MPFEQAHHPPAAARARRRTISQPTIGFMILVLLFVIVPILAAMN